jgi:hypothetical protein
LSARTASIVLRKWSAPPSRKSSRATAVITTWRSRMRLVASATRFGSSGSSGKGLAVVTAQKRQARVHRSPPIMKVAVPLLQHSQWLGHLALSHTVCRFSSCNNDRVCANAGVVGRLPRSHAGSRGRERSAGSVRFKLLIFLFYFSPEIRQLVRPEIRKHVAIHINYRRQLLPRKPDHLVECSLVGYHVDALVINPLVVQPPDGFMTPPAVRLYE